MLQEALELCLEDAEELNCVASPRVIFREEIYPIRF